MSLNIRIEDRTGGTPANRKKRQPADPPHILLADPGPNPDIAMLETVEKPP